MINACKVLIAYGLLILGEHEYAYPLAGEMDKWAMLLGISSFLGWYRQRLVRAKARMLTEAEMLLDVTTKNSSILKPNATSILGNQTYR